MENQYFAGHILEYKGNIVEYAIKQSAKQRNEKAHPNIQSGPTTGEEAAQAHSETNQRKVMARRLYLGTAAPRVCPHPASTNRTQLPLVVSSML